MAPGRATPIWPGRRIGGLTLTWGQRSYVMGIVNANPDSFSDTVRTTSLDAQVALDLAVPIPTIAAAIDARVLSSMKEERIRASRILGSSPPSASSA